MGEQQMKPYMKSIIIDTGRSYYLHYGFNYGKPQKEVFFAGEDYEEEIVVYVKKTRKEARRGEFGDWEFNDRLNPLRRWLSRQDGKKWDDVYSEIRKVNDYRNVKGRHLIDHLFGEVCINKKPLKPYYRFFVDEDGIFRENK